MTCEPGKSYWSAEVTGSYWGAQADIVIQQCDTSDRCTVADWHFDIGTSLHAVDAGVYVDCRGVVVPYIGIWPEQQPGHYVDRVTLIPAAGAQLRINVALSAGNIVLVLYSQGQPATSLALPVPGNDMAPGATMTWRAVQAILPTGPRGPSHGCLECDVATGSSTAQWSNVVLLGPSGWVPLSGLGPAIEQCPSVLEANYATSAFGWQVAVQGGYPAQIPGTSYLPSAPTSAPGTPGTAGTPGMPEMPEQPFVETIVTNYPAGVALARLYGGQPAEAFAGEIPPNVGIGTVPPPGTPETPETPELPETPGRITPVPTEPAWQALLGWALTAWLAYYVLTRA